MTKPKAMPGISVSLDPINRMPGANTPAGRVLSEMQTRTLQREYQAAGDLLRQQGHLVEIFKEVVEKYAILDQLPAIRAAAAAAIVNRLTVGINERKAALLDAEAKLVAAQSQYDSAVAAASLAAQHARRKLIEARLQAAELDDFEAVAVMTQAARREAMARKQRAAFDQSGADGAVSLDALRRQRAELQALFDEEAASGRDTSKLAQALADIDARIAAAASGGAS